MKLLLKVSIDEFCDAGADYAFVDLTPEWAKSLLTRKAIFDLAHAQDSELYEMHYWWEPCMWLGGSSVDTDESVPEGEDLYDFLECLSMKQSKQLDGGDPVILLDDFTVPEYFAQRTEMGQTIVMERNVRFTSYPKHVDFEQHTMDIPWAVIDQAIAKVV